MPVPSLVSATPDDATAQLEALGLTAKLGAEYSLTVPEGLVSSTRPGENVRVAKGSAVSVLVSQGPRPITLPVLAGATEADATKAITDAKAIAETTDQIFAVESPAGTVITATRDGDGADLSQGGDALEGQTINLTVSLGPVPDVTGKSLSGAIAALEDVGLVGVEGENTYSDDYAEGEIIAAVPAHDGPFRQGDSFSLTVSRGPQPVVIPDVKGKTWSEAKPILEDVGLKLDYNLFADAAPGLFSVTTVTPSAGTTVPKGTTVKVNFFS